MFSGLRTTKSWLYPTMFVGVWTLFATTALFSEGFLVGTQWNISVVTDARAARAEFGDSDAGNYLQAALGLWDRGPWGIDGNRHIYNVWPPGMVVVNLGLIGLEAVFGVPFVAGLAAVNATVFSFTMVTVVRALESLQRYTGILFSLAVLLTSLFYPMATVFIAYPDLLGSCFFILGAIVLTQVDQKAGTDRLLRILASGIFLAVAMHFRAPFDTVTLAIILIGLSWSVSIFFRHRFFEKPRPTPTAFKLSSLTAAAMVAQALSLPWRVIASIFTRPGDFRWSTALDLSGVFRWVPTDALREAGIGFVADGHGNFGCTNDPGRCTEIGLTKDYLDSPFTNDEYLTMLWQSFLERPGVYFFERFSSFLHGFSSVTGAAVGELNIAEAAVIMLSFLVALMVFARSREAKDNALWALLAGITVGAGILFVFHIETRYLLPVKFEMLTFTFLVLANHQKFQRLKSISGWSSPAA